MSAEKLSLGCRQAELLRDTVHWPRRRGWESSTAYSPHEFLGCVVPFRRDHRGSKLLLPLGCRIATRRCGNLGGQRGTIGLLFPLQSFRYSRVPVAGRCGLRLRTGVGHAGSASDGPIRCGFAHDPIAEARARRFALTQSSGS